MQQYFRSLAKKRHVIALQEVAAIPSAGLACYQAVSGPPGGRGISILVDRKLTHHFRDLGQASGGIEYVMVEILLDPPRRGLRRNSIYVLNVYSSPRSRTARFKSLLKKAVDLAGTRPLIVVGDFNAPYALWGYAYNTRKGWDLWQSANEVDLTLIKDNDFPTRIGNSVCKDTTPDLTFVKNVTEVEWENSALDFGSDYYFLG